MQKYLSFFVVLFSFFFLFGGWGEELCEDQTCSGHGECQEDGENEWCACDEGYIADGMDCILGCNGVTCSGHGVCSVVSGAEICTCEAGFHATGLNCILNEASTVDTLAILNGTDCYNTGNCHYRLILATGAYSFTPALSSLYDIIVNVLDSENVWHNYRKTVAQCVTEGVCDNVDAQYIDFWFQHNVNGNQYVTVELLGNGDDASDDMYHDVLIDYCYGVDCGTGGTCDDTSGYPVCNCEYGYVLRDGVCEEGWFEDENLAAAVVEMLKYKGYDVETETDIEPEMLADIESLALRHQNISSLTGIELFSSLSVLDVSENHINDLSPLENCSGLKVLNISSNPVSDLTPLSGLPLYSIDISYSGVYNLNPLALIGTLSELIFADTENDRHGMLRPDNTAVGLWLGNLLGCNESVLIYGSAGNTYEIGLVGIGGGCRSHASCVNGRCLCDDGYVYSESTNSCFDPDDCGSGYHYDSVSGTCVSNIGKYNCGALPENSEIVSNRTIIWNGSEYAVPTGYTTNLCHSGDSGCAESICQWDCRTGYAYVRDDICVPNNATRFIPESAYTQMILPDISRRDAALEPIPGVPSFSPVLKAELRYDARGSLKAGWYLDLPRVELNIDNLSPTIPLYVWNQKSVYVYMPWGREEYSIVAEKKCFDSDNAPISQCTTSYDLSNADHVEITYYPAPGQNLFSYVVLKTTGKACEISYSYTNGEYFYYDDNSKDKDTWEITRYGSDGSVTEFYRGGIFSNFGNNVVGYASRPANYRFMDYIPISKYTTRDHKEIVFKYDWQVVKTDSQTFSHYSITSVNIIDPLRRVVRIASDSAESGLMGKPGLRREPLEGNISISSGRALLFNNLPVSLTKVAEYSVSDGFDMTAEIYKSGSWIRRDTYSKKGRVLELSSSTGDDDVVGSTVWTVTANNDNKPDGYTERKLINNDSEYALKTVKGVFHQETQETYKKYYSLSLPENENNRHKITTVYSHETSGTPVSKRIVEDYFNDWLQPAKRVTCKPNSNSDENCTNNTTSVTEEIKYNAGGSPIYFKDADGQITVNFYDTADEVSVPNYINHFYQIPAPGTYANFDPDLHSELNIFRSDSLRKSGTLLCSAVYSLNTVSVDEMLSDYAYGINWNPNRCGNTENSRVTNYNWTKEALEKPYDLKTITYPDGKTKTFTYDYEINPTDYIPNGKVWGETITGSNSQNTLQTCYAYNNDYQLIKQGIGPAGNNCDPKKGFLFNTDSGLLMTTDFSYGSGLPLVIALANDYIYDSMGRKIAERNSAGISTVYVYDSLDRVVFTFFGCDLEDTNSFDDRVYEPYNFNGSDTAGEDGRGVAFSYTSGQFPYARYMNFNFCQYYRKYKYDAMSNLTETYFFEYWGVNSNNQIVKNTTSPKIIKQKTEYDMLGRAVKSCQFDATLSEPDKRCIETEHDIFGNIVKKEEAVYDQDDHKRNDVHGEIREITYDLRNRPLTVTVDGLQTEEYSYSNTAAGGYFGYDTIKNKYEDIEPLKTYKDKWGRAAKSVDPFGNETSTVFESDYSDNIVSQTTTSSGTKTAETVWTYDDLDRKLTETRKQFIPGSESTTNVNHVTYWDYDSIGNVISVESSDGTKQTYSYDTMNRPVETVNYEKIDSNWVEASSSANSYDANGRLFRTQTTKNNQTITEDYGFDTFGRVTAVRTTDPANSSRYRVKFYNTGGQVIWEADEESDADPRSYSDLGLWNVEVGNQKYYTYNAFGDLEKTVYVMTDTGIGLGYPDTNPWLNNSQITTNFTYDIFGRITSRTNDRSGVTAYSYYDENIGTSHSLNKLQSIQIFPAVDNNSNYTNSTQTYTYTYDDKGDELTVAYQEGNYLMEVVFTRDDYGRIISKTSNGSVPVTQTFTYNMRNLLETATDTVGNAAPISVTRLYDSLGNPYSESVSADYVTKTVSRRMTDAKTYQFTYPDGKIIRKTATGNDLDLIEYNNSEIASYSRADGVLTAVTKGQNLTETFSYNNWNMLDNHTVSNANADVYDMSYNYSRGWHLIEKADGIRNTSDKYTYDSYYRLKEVKYDFTNNTAARTDSFYQDGVHNIEQSTENGTTFAWGVDKLNRLREKKIGSNTESAYEYDERNNMISEDRSGTSNDRTYIYDDLNRLIEVKDGSNNTIATYTYDAFNRRITKTVGNTTERYTYDDWDIVEIATNSDLYTNIIDSGTDRHIAIEVTANNASTLYYFLTDERGNVTALADANGNILERYRYRVYGDFEILDSQFTPKNCNNQTCYATNLHNFLWGGSLYEPETGLYWMRNRYYHIDMHRFINQDPIGIWGDANNLGNGFAYVAGMVIEASDPTGLDLRIFIFREFSTNFGIFGTLVVLDDEEVIFTAKVFEGRREKNKPAFSENISFLGKLQNRKFNDTGELYPIRPRIRLLEKDHISIGRQIHQGFLPSNSSGCFLIANEIINQNPKSEKDQIFDKDDSEWALSTLTDIIENLGDPVEIIIDPENNQKEELDYSSGIKQIYPNNATQKCDSIGCWCESGDCSGTAGENIPSDPDSTDGVQTYFANQFVKKILEMHEKKNFLEMMEEEGPVIKYDDNGRKVFIFNPYYKGKDPMKQTYWKTKNADGTNGFVRNPFAAPSEYNPFISTADTWFNSNFNPGNIDPYWY